MSSTYRFSVYQIEGDLNPGYLSIKIPADDGDGPWLGKAKIKQEWDYREQETYVANCEFSEIETQEEVNEDEQSKEKYYIEIDEHHGLEFKEAELSEPDQKRTVQKTTQYEDVEVNMIGGYLFLRNISSIEDSWVFSLLSLDLEKINQSSIQSSPVKSSPSTTDPFEIDSTKGPNQEQPLENISGVEFEDSNAVTSVKNNKIIVTGNLSEREASKVAYNYIVT